MDKERDPARHWDPIDAFWRIFYPALNPRPDASPVRLDPPAPIWDLPRFEIYFIFYSFHSSFSKL